MNIFWIPATKSDRIIAGLFVTGRLAGLAMEGSDEAAINKYALGGASAGGVQAGIVGYALEKAQDIRRKEKKEIVH